MKIKPNYIVIPGLTILTAISGSLITKNESAQLWYHTVLTLPRLTPPNWIFPIAWNTIFILFSIAALIVWNRFKHNKNFLLMVGLFIVNLLANFLWSWLFFSQHLIGAALLDAIFLEIVTVWLCILIGRESIKIALLILPYIAWNIFAIYLNYLIWILN